MNAGEVVIAAIGAAGGAGGAIFAWVQAKAAVDERKDAEAAQGAAERARDEALSAAKRSADAADRQAAASETANTLLAEAQALNERLAPPAWSQARFPGKTTMAFDNQSGRNIVLTSVVLLPDGTFIRLEVPTFPFRVENGDAFGVRWRSAYTLPPPERAILEWHYEGEPESPQITERNL